MIKNSIAYNRTLFLEDNLPVLRGLDTDSIDLIATDPPFNKGVPVFEGTTKAGVDVEFSDVWRWDDVHDDWVNSIGKEHPNLFNVIHYANGAAGNDMGAFLCWMAVRVLEMHRVLKPTGSIYLHCDPTASHYLKAMMDAIFGRKNFRNEIVWKRTNAPTASVYQFGRVHDTVFMYAKSELVKVNPVYVPYTTEYVEKHYKHSDDGGQFQATPLTAQGTTGGHSGQPWRGVDVNEKGLHWVVPSAVPEWVELPEEYERMTSLEKLDWLDEHGLIYWPKRGKVPRFKRYLSTSKGARASDLITDISGVQGASKEKTGYPTQKPLALYKRMIEASSNPGDMVLDPFAGCATTCVAAEQMGRQWIGIDIREESGDIILDRLQNEVSASMAWNGIVRTPTEAPNRTDDGEPAAPDLVLDSPKRNAKRIPVPEVRARLEARDGLRCQGCGWAPHRLDYMQVDHKKPKKEGGATDMSNFVLLCEPCNRKKSYKMSLRELQRARILEGWMDMDWWEREGRLGMNSSKGRNANQPQVSRQV